MCFRITEDGCSDSRNVLRINTQRFTQVSSLKCLLYHIGTFDGSTNKVVESSVVPNSWNSLEPFIFFHTFLSYNITKVALRVRAAIISSIYQKALSVSSSRLSTFSTGKIVSLMSTDSDKIRGFFYNFHDAWSAPFKLAVCMYLLYVQVCIIFSLPL